MTDKYTQIEEEALMDKLKDIILREDREALLRIQNILDDPDELSPIIGPIIEEHIASLKQNFPKEFERSVNRLIDRKLENSRDQIVSAIYPSLGKMVRKYINNQFQMLKERVDESLRTTFSAKSMAQRIRTKVFGLKDSDTILTAIDKPHIDEIFMIQHQSGLLLGHASGHKAINQDVIAGMLTAIKSFGEDSFNIGSEDLEMIEYGTSKIFLQAFPTYYFALVVSGSLSATEKDKISSELIEFAQKEMMELPDQIDDSVYTPCSEKLYEYFINTSPKG